MLFANVSSSMSQFFELEQNEDDAVCYSVEEPKKGAVLSHSNVRDLTLSRQWVPPNPIGFPSESGLWIIIESLVLGKLIGSYLWNL
jgi:hypothetical protein